MQKNTLKSIFLSLIIIILFIIILIVIKEQFFQMNKIIPTQVKEYIPKQSIIKNDDTDKDNIYEVNNSDLTIYKQSKNYNKERLDPFEINTETKTEEKNTDKKTTLQTKTNNDKINMNKTNTSTKKVVTSSVKTN